MHLKCDLIISLLALSLFALSAVHSAENMDAAEDSTEESMELSLQSTEVSNAAPPNTAESTIASTQMTNQFETTNSFEEPRPQLRNIKTLDDHCLKGFCYNFNYGRLDEVAFFDIKPDVHINKDRATYDIVNEHNYDTLIFEKSTFARFPLHLFYAIGVKELDMRNCSIQVMTWECFLMSQDLRILLLSNNLLQTIEASTFKFASDLQYLFLDSNRLTLLHPSSFEGLTKLRYLDMHQNFLTQLPAGLFDQLPALEELHLDDNRLHTLNNQLFLNNLNLKILTLGANRLQDIGENTFRRQAQLIILDISNNPELRTLVLKLQLRNLVASNCALRRVNIYGYVRNVDLSYNRILELYFAEPQQLETLNLRNNSLQLIASLSRATNLQVLDLGDNPELGTLPSPWLANALKRLDLGNTGLRQLPIEAIADQEQLNFLNVSYNQLREINPLNFPYLEQLSHFDIRANNWNCYNLNILMEILLNPHKIIYGYDEIDPEYPGTYINKIACMYRLEEDSAEEDLAISNQQQVEAVSGNTLGQLVKLRKNTQEHVETFRRELKAIVGFYEQKFDHAFRMIDDLNARLENFERLNETILQHVTITV
ncbi:leucine-rich repeat-containing G-protein coupled receptor 5-like [Anastrepha ludens]|uniref:leucine-rich repeat-containing G-protein coupled receptor 5-like n=1 Tax=Anastrepha ludens TaxID=28586 RepID=UPI0023AE74A2|nr:leucine-rich repeat-containing G-protein coupled receptor 5-like [Anastrepha ludens]